MPSAAHHGAVGVAAYVKKRAYMPVLLLSWWAHVRATRNMFVHYLIKSFLFGQRQIHHLQINGLLKIMTR